MRDINWQEDIGYLLKVDYYVIWLTQNTPMVVKTSIFVKATFPRLCVMIQQSVVMGFWTNLILDWWLISQSSTWAQPSSITLSARGVFSRGTFPLIVTAQQLLVTSSSRIFYGYFTCIYYDAINLTTQITIFKKPELWKRKFSTYLTMLPRCSFFSLAFYKRNVFQRTRDNRPMTQVWPVREYFKGTSVMCEEIPH